MQVRTPGDIGHLIRDARRRQGVTQAALAKKLGVAHSWLSEVENGKPTAEIGKVLQVLAFLELELDVTSRRERIAPAADAYPDLDDIVGGGQS